MMDAINVFYALVKQNELLGALYMYLSIQRIPLDFTDLLRWQWAVSVAALDKFIHDVIRIGMIEVFEGRRPATPKSKSFKLTLQNYIDFKAADNPIIDLTNEFDRQNSIVTYQHPDKIVDGLSLIWDEPHKWEVIRENFSSPISADDLKTKLKNIITRRNQIVHQCDCLSPTLPLEQQPISSKDVEDVTLFLIELVRAIDKSIPRV
jgi:hypothetical protein